MIDVLRIFELTWTYGPLRILIGMKVLWFLVARLIVPYIFFLDFSRNLEHFLHLVSFSRVFLALVFKWTISLLFNQGFFQESDDDMEVFPTDGLLKRSLVGTGVNFETTLELEIQESDKESLSVLIYTSLSMDAQKELNGSESCPFVPGVIFSITQSFRGQELRAQTPVLLVLCKESEYGFKSRDIKGGSCVESWHLIVIGLNLGIRDWYLFEISWRDNNCETWLSE